MNHDPTTRRADAGRRVATPGAAASTASSATRSVPRLRAAVRPATAGAEHELTWPEATVRSESRTLLRSDPEEWHLEIELEVFDGDERIARRRWERTIPRDLQ